MNRLAGVAAASAALALTCAVGSAASPPPAGADASEAAAVVAVVRRGLAEAPKDFSAIRGKRIAAGRYASTATFGKSLSCEIQDRPEGPPFVTWRLFCQSIKHKRSVYELAGWLQGTIQTHVPAGWSFSLDNNSIDDYFLGWQPSGDHPFSVGAFVSEDRRGSFYTLSVYHEYRR